MRPTVLLLTPTLATIGGVETYYRALDLERHDKRVQYFFVTSATEESFRSRTYRLCVNYLRFWRMLGRRDCRLVVLNPSLNPSSFYRDAIFCRLALLRRKRVLVFFRGWSNSMESTIQNSTVARLVFRFSFGSARHFIVLADTFRDKLMALGCSPDSRFWIESTVADEALAAGFAIESRFRDTGPLRVLFISRLVASKAPRLAIEAFALAQQANPELRFELTIAGDGPEASSVAALVRDLNIPNVTLVGPVSGAAKVDLLTRSDVLLFPTCHGEGMPNVVLEAMLFGMPVITRDVGGIRAAISHGVNGFLTSETNPATFADWLVELATNHALRHKMARENYEKARELYTSSAVRTRFREIIDSILEAATTDGSETTCGTASN